MSGNTRMTFGKFKGYLLKDIESDYLYWVLENANPSPGLDLDIREELQARHARAYGKSSHESYASMRPMRLPAGVTIGAALEIIEVGRRTAAKKHHPDVGGSTAAMTAVNASADFLEEQIRALFQEVR